MLATGDRNNGLVVWEAQTGREFFDLRGHTAAITDISWRLDSNVVASSSEDGTVKLWEMENGGNIKTIGAHGGGVESVRFAKDGRLVIDRPRPRGPALGRQRQQAARLRGVRRPGPRGRLQPRRITVVAADWSGEIRVWDAKDGKRLANLAVNPAPIAVRLEQVKKALAAAQAEADSLARQLGPLQAAATAAAAAQAKAQQDLCRGRGGRGEAGRVGRPARPGPEGEAGSA